jgi:hypothetical protein
MLPLGIFGLVATAVAVSVPVDATLSFTLVGDWH